MGNALSLVVSIGVPLAGGIVGGLVTQKDVLTWYPKIKKPKWTPPNFLFAPVWTALYVMMGTASWLVWKKKGNNAVALSLYGAQLVLNLIWNPLFFKSHKTDVALVDITALLGLATAATVTMARASSAAVQLPLMVPYLVWVSYATALNAKICLDNPSERLIKPRGQKAAEAKAESKSKTSPVAAVKEAAAAASTGVEAAKAAAEAVTAAGDAKYGKAILAADKLPTSGSAAVQHAAAAAKPVVTAVEGAKEAAKAATTALGITAPAAAKPPAAAAPAAGPTPTSAMAPASKAIAAEVKAAEKAAATATTSTATVATAAPAAAATAAAGAAAAAADTASGSARRTTADAVKAELKHAGV
ncbi:hypothetical protein CHLRE_24g755497v5 [Chlamydomonas reinhardtii]|uniref:Uncharacterized protein n=1 Tax=Chlamydomonas reinhardtii TaxID=3055 RepID=A0A2K3CN34_CHLRE|nr:uncharacterized protein CHLRE_24g755497v5 [Chlamydomonas reinhardtii]PNW69694.1 hypothetical protein CHLRE_24g755497v5 [Chlamydomonas reinhardtii]